MLIASTHRIAACATLLLAAFLVPVNVEAQVDLDTGTDNAIQAMLSTGSTLKQFRAGRLGNLGTVVRVLRVPAGKSAFVVAVCDEYCGDLNLQVNAGGRDLGSDTETNPLAIVEIQRFSGPMSVRVSMAGCRVESCEYRVMLFIK